MTDKYEDLIRRLEDRDAGMHFPRDILFEAATAIKELVARAEKAEADLAAARAAARSMSIAFEAVAPFAYRLIATEHATAIAAARAEGGE